MWWFAGGCYMLELLPSSLRLTAIYGLVIAASVIVFGASVGRLVDTMGRISAARLSLAIQNLATAACALILAAFLHYRAELEPDGPDHPTLIVSVLAITLAAVARLASCGTNIIIQKDWIVVIAGGDNDKLATMNSILRTIELTTYAIAPAVAGCLFTLLGFGLTGLVIAAWNGVSVCLEYCLLSRIYRRHPGLASKRSSSSVEEEEDGGAAGGAVQGWLTYFNHPVKLAGLGLACLYMTVLGFDNITYGFCLLQGVPHAVLGILVGVSAVVGVAGSLAYPPIRKRVGLERTGLLGMFLLVSCSSLALVSILLPGSPMDLNVLIQSKTNSSILLSPTTIIPEDTNSSASGTKADSEDTDVASWLLANCSVIVFLSGIILARFGLWVVDLTVNQLLQEKVEEEVRGVVNGVQESLNNSLDLAKCILVILLPAEETFGLLIIASFTSVSLGWLLYALYSRQQRGHLFHFQRLAASLSCIPHQQQQPDKEVIEEKEKMLEKEEEERAVVVKKIEKRKKGEVCSV